MHPHRAITVLVAALCVSAASCTPPAAPVPRPLPSIPTPPTLPKLPPASTTTTTVPPVLGCSSGTSAASQVATHDVSPDTGSAALEVAPLEGAALADATSVALSDADGGALSVVVVTNGRPDVVVVDDADADLVASGDVAGDGDIIAVEAVQTISITASKANDTLRSTQWSFDAVPFEAAWACSTGADVDIAIVDTGVDAHSEFTGRLSGGVSVLNLGPIVEGAGNVDPHGHGTHVAGIAAAAANNSSGIAGVAPAARIIPVRVLDANGSGYDTDVARGINWAVDNGAEVINLSLGADTRSAAITTAIAYANAEGVVVVAAAGNEGPSGTASWPGAEPGVIAVAASTSAGEIATYSNRGDYVDIAAPGSSILSTVAGGYTYKSGTSMAAPHVAGVAALLIAANPSMSDTEVIDILLSTATDRGAAGVDPMWGAGLVDPVGALTR